MARKALFESLNEKKIIVYIKSPLVEMMKEVDLQSPVRKNHHVTVEVILYHMMHSSS